MCTAILYPVSNCYFGRNLDWTTPFGQQVVITPRDYRLNFRQLPSLDHHYAITGMAIVQDDYPLYFDGANEAGLGMAGLNFAGLAHYFPVQADRQNVSPFELIPYVLGQCQTVTDAKQLLSKSSLAAIKFSSQMPLAPLHWLVADKSGAAITVESTVTGLHIYDNPVQVLTNNPAFPAQLTNLANYQGVSPALAANTLAPGVDLEEYSRGLGSRQLPVGMDSESRFVRAVFTLQHAPHGKTAVDNITDYFHCLHAVEQPKGFAQVGTDQFEYTIYSDGIDLTTRTLYYTSYDNSQINAVPLPEDKCGGQQLYACPLITHQSINIQN